MKIQQADEIIKTLSGQTYPLTAADIEKFVAELSRNLAQCIKPNSVVGLFLPLGNLCLLPLLIYRVCIDCGAVVLRFGNTQIERQLWILNNFDVDIIIAPPSIWRLIALNSKVKYDWFAYLTLGEEQKGFDKNELMNAKRIFIELYHVPAFLIQNEDKSYECPCYSCEILTESSVRVNGNMGQLVITYNNIGGFNINSFHTGINVIPIEGRQEFYIDLYKECMDIDDDKLHSRIKKIMRRHNIKIEENEKLNNLDSLGIVELLVALEEEFSFRVNIDEINKGDFLNYNSILRFVTKKLNETKYRGEA